MYQFILFKMKFYYRFYEKIILDLYNCYYYDVLLLGRSLL